MARVMHSWICAAHGRFMGYNGDCPHGCSSALVRKELGASISSGAKSEKTKFIDRKTADLARQFGESDFNDRYDQHRINMNVSDDIQKKRLAGQTYAVPLGKDGVGEYLGATGGSDPALTKRMRQSATEGLQHTNVVKDDLGKTTLSE